MSLKNKILVTIVTEASLESAICKQLGRLGASGHTITDARGKGSQGQRGGGWDADSNIRIEVICNETVAQAITDFAQSEYFDNFAMVVYSHPVSVARTNKF
ncbi:transcriptional regulator [Porticoccaceae bacterium]|nr:transcriptional regulator [Porticoccaceae bacterium]